MGLFSFKKNQSKELIEWTDTSSHTLVKPISIANPIKMGAILMVRESQVAVFVNEGKVTDLFAPGKYILSQENLPLLSGQLQWKLGYKAPFTADVYYVNTKPFTSNKWATINPLVMRTPHLGNVVMKANGTYAFRVSHAEKIMKEIFGSNQIYDTPYLLGQLRSILLSGLTELIVDSKLTIPLDHACYDVIGDATENKVQSRFSALGIELCTFLIDQIVVPEEEEKDIIEVIDPLKCKHCDNSLINEMKFCPQCGEKT